MATLSRTKQKERAVELAKKLKRQRVPFCEKCGKSKQQGWQIHAHHVVPVGYDATAADIDNLVSLCATCHSMGRASAHDHPHEFTRWYDEAYPNKYDKLRERAERYVQTKFPKIDWNEVYLELKQNT